MNRVETFYSTLNHGLYSFSQKIQHIATHPSTVKKILQIGIKLFAAIDCYHGMPTQSRGVTEAMKNNVDLIDFYVSFKNILFWIEPFSNQSLDRQQLIDSLGVAFGENVSSQSTIETATEIVNQSLAQRDHYGPQEVRKSIQEVLQQKNIPQAEQILEKLVISKKRCSFLQALQMVCLTIGSLGTNAKALHNWGVIGVPKQIAQAGIVVLEAKARFANMLGVVGSVGLGSNLIRVSYRAFQIGSQSTKGDSFLAKVRADVEYQAALMTVLDVTLDFTVTTLPLFFAFSPPTLVTMGLIVKGIGLTRVLIYE